MLPENKRALLKVSYLSILPGQTSKPACLISSFLVDLTGGNGKLELVFLKNVKEYQRFCRRKDATDIASALKKYHFGGYCVVGYYHGERAHQGLDNEIIEPPPQGEGEIVCHERLGGLLKFYRRAA